MVGTVEVDAADAYLIDNWFELTMDLIWLRMLVSDGVDKQLVGVILQDIFRVGLAERLV